MALDVTSNLHPGKSKAEQSSDLPKGWVALLLSQQRPSTLQRKSRQQEVNSARVPALRVCAQNNECRGEHLGDSMQGSIAPALASLSLALRG